jgi:hypothetical protein
LNNKNTEGEDEKHLTEEGDDLLDNIFLSNENEWKWWIIRSENTLPQLWSIITNFLTIYALFVTPVVLVFPEVGDYLEDFELFVDICFTIDICFSFIRLETHQKEDEFPKIRLNYLKSWFIFDCIAALPGLITLEKSSSIFKICRFIHYDRVFEQLNYFTENVLQGWLGYTRQKVGEYVEFIRLEITVILITHVMACLWIIIGMADVNGWVNTFIEAEKASTGDLTIDAYKLA